jgi:hypothetical protein
MIVDGELVSGNEQVERGTEYEKKVLRFRNKLVQMNVGKNDSTLNFAIKVIDMIVDGELVFNQQYSNGGGVIFQVGDMVKIMPNYSSHYTNNKGEIVKIMPDNKTYEVKIKHKTGNEYVKFDISELVFLGNQPKYAGGGEAKKRRRSASIQYGRSDTAVDKTRVAKPVGYRFTNAKASELRKDPYAKPTEAQVKKYLGKGIYKENRKRHSDKDRIAKL